MEALNDAAKALHTERKTYSSRTSEPNFSVRTKDSEAIRYSVPQLDKPTDSSEKAQNNEVFIRQNWGSLLDFLAEKRPDYAPQLQTNEKVVNHKYWENDASSLNVRFDSSLLHEVREANRKKAAGIVNFVKKLGQKASVAQTVQLI